MSGADDDSEHGYRVPRREPTRPRSKARSSDESDTPLAVDLQPRQVRVEPGAAGTVRLRVRNTGSVVDAIAIEVAGEAAAWATVVPAELRIYPGTEGEAVVTFRPPRAPWPPAGLHEAQIALNSSERPAASAQASLLLEIAPYDELSASLAPRYASTKREFTTAVKLVNQGNRSVAAGITATDPHQALDFAAQPQNMAMEPGDESTSWLRMRPRRRSRFGRPQTYPFDVTVTPVPGSPRALDGRLEVVPLLPAWMALVGGLVLIVAIAGGVGCGLRVIECLPSGGETPTPTPTATTTPGVTDTPRPATPTPTGATPTPTSGQRVVPDVEGLQLDEAVIILQREGFTAFPRAMPAPGVPAFTVLSTDPPVGSPVSVGADVRVFFAFGR